jgi:hypothetical protein
VRAGKVAPRVKFNGKLVKSKLVAQDARFMELDVKVLFARNGDRVEVVG